MSTQTPPPSDSEIGYVNPEPMRGLGLGVPDWASFDVDAHEHVNALKWPASILIYDRMRADPQIDALMRGLTLPIRRFRWEIDPSGADQEIVDNVSADFGLPVIGQRERRGLTQNRFNHDENLRTAFLALIYGHMFTEQVGAIEPGVNGQLLWRLKKLAPRAPHSIQEIKVARDGGLVWIKQKGEWVDDKIPIDRLVVFVHEREGANWFGRSLLRSAYQPWILKDRLLRVDAIRHERNGMGVPIVELPERASETQRQEGNKLAQQYKAGVASGGAIPYGMKLRLIGVEGQTSDVLASIRYHDEAMARLMLQMFAQLATQAASGSKALGDTLIKYLAKGQDAVADWYANTMNLYMVDDWVEWNYGTDAERPRIVYRRDENPELAAQEFAQLVAQGVLSVDNELEDFLRDRYGLPPRGDSPRKSRVDPEDAVDDTPPPPDQENLNVDPGPVKAESQEGVA